MSDAEPPHTPGPRPRYEPIAMGGVFKRSALVLYALLAVGLAALAVYMATLGQREVMSMYVAAPAIGAVWFALRVFMMLGPRR
ncbi:MAG TPA: hypothetical protein VEA80_00265 [Vitreimonas sp.]|uniref:hypothetical protein n=1 Tax=Vitreimonas sp. TaxID=3069702 RepID=UPI002D6068F2|nr:hypothetical protein [Vitreimonas sp.]HYD85887.1 hypothetical protein [Vitreimonas sp.]